jgi:zinc-ribbon domain
MTDTSSPGAGAQICPQCGTPTVPGMKFCESCGAKLDTPVTGPVTPEETMTASAPEKKEKPVPPPASPVSGASGAPRPAEPGRGANFPKEPGQKKPIPQKTLIIAGVLILAILGALVYFVALPALMGSGSPNPGVNTQLPQTPSSAGVSPAGTPGASPVAAPTFTAGPTQVPPAKLAVILDAERDPITSEITVTFKGGAGQFGVSNILVILTRSDGQVLTGSFKPTTAGSGVTLQGTPRTDRVEATATYYSGEHYKIMDQIFEYVKRNG